MRHTVTARQAPRTPLESGGAAALGRQGVSRGRVWTAGELQALITLPDRTPDVVTALAVAKREIDGRHRRRSAGVERPEGPRRAKETRRTEAVTLYASRVGFHDGGVAVFQGSVGSASDVVRVDLDAGLVEALRRDDRDAADRLVDRYGDRAYRLAWRILGVREDAEEAVQDALCIAARKIHTFRGDAAFASWFYRVAANAAYQKLRRRRRKAHEIALDDVLPALDSEGHFAAIDDWSKRIDDTALQSDLRDVLTDAIDALPPDYRTALVLHDVEGLSNPDIAGTLGISLPAVKSRIHRSRLFLRQRLSEHLRRDPGE